MIAAVHPVRQRIAAIEARIAAVAPAAAADFAATLGAVSGDALLGAGSAGVLAEPSTVPSTMSSTVPPTASSLAAAPLPGTYAVPNPYAPAWPAAVPAVPAGSTGSAGGGLAAPVPYGDEFVAAGERYGVPPALLAAVGWVESRYQPGAVSPDGAQGVMQLMPFVSAELGVDAFDPAAAIDGGARLLAGHYQRFGSWDLAVAAYHSGAGAVARAGGVPTARAADYVGKVMTRMAEL